MVRAKVSRWFGRLADGSGEESADGSGEESMMVSGEGRVVLGRRD